MATGLARLRANREHGRRPQVKKQRRWLREIKFHQARTAFEIPRKPFQRLVREITQAYFARPPLVLRFEARAMDALQSAAEERLVALFQTAYLITLDAGRVVIQPRDLQLARRIMGPRSE